MEAQTLNDIFLKTSSIERPAVQKYKRAGTWHDITVPDFTSRVRSFSCGLRALGVKAGDRVAILSENRPEWTQTDFAILAAGAVSVPIYSTLLAPQIEFILQDSGCVLAFVSNDEQMQKVLEIRHLCPALREVIVCDAPSSLPSGVMTVEQVRQLGDKEDEAEGRTRFDQIVRSAKADDLATIVYTSGTTGNPKGAMLTHRNITSNVIGTTSIMPFAAADIALCILPLSHILERMADFSYLYLGGCIAYAENVANVRDNLLEVKPTVFAAVPRLFEKMHATIMDTVAQAPAARQKLFHWALRLGADRLPYRVEHRRMPAMMMIKSLVADRLVFKRIHERLGGRIRFVLSGGAPLSAELAAFFIGAGVEILEGYGLTETSPVITINTLDHRRIGTVGRAIPGVEVKIAEDGEILTRGPHVMTGYFNNDEATALAIDHEGWFYTGDIGELDADGFLKITDRKKDIIINAYGKNIAPQPLEGLLKTSPYIATPVLIGDRRKYLSALIVPNFERLERDARQIGVTFNSRQEMVTHPEVVMMVQKEIDRFNRSLDRQVHIRRFALLPEDFTIESGEITPSLKVKRKAVDQKYKELIDGMYADQSEA